VVTVDSTMGEEITINRGVSVIIGTIIAGEMTTATIGTKINRTIVGMKLVKMTTDVHERRRGGANATSSARIAMKIAVSVPLPRHHS